MKPERYFTWVDTLAYVFGVKGKRVLYRLADRFLILLFIGFAVAGFCAGWYILILPFTVCIDGLKVRHH